MSDRIEFVDLPAEPWASLPLKAFERADLVVLPYRAFESQSGVLHDAYSHGVPVVVTSGYDQGSTTRRSSVSAALGFLQKPYTARELVAVVDGALTD